LLGILVTTATVSWRHQAVTADRNAAVDSADAHFRGVLFDHERQIAETQREIEIVLLGATTYSDQDVDLSVPSISKQLERLDSSTLPGIRGYLLWRGDSTVVVSEVDNGLDFALLAELDDFEVEAGMAVDTFWMSRLSPAAGSAIVVGIATKSDQSLLAVFDNDQFIFGDIPSVHGVVVDFAETSPGDETGPGQDGHNHEADQVTHEHAGDEVRHDHGGGGGFFTSSEVSLFGREWMLDISTTRDFIETTASREVPVLILFGVALSVILYVLVRRLSHSRSQAEEELEANAERFDAGFENSPIGVVELDVRGKLVKVNESAVVLLGTSYTDLLDSDLVDHVSKQGRAEAERHLIRARDSRTSGQLEVRFDSGDRPVWAQLTTSNVNSLAGARHTLVQMVDVTERRSAREELERRALHDELTGLPNRALLADRLHQSLARSQRNGLYTAAIFIDLDNFKRVNDSAGHQAGDQLLKETARRRETDTVARFGGDEFVVLCEDLDSPSEAQHLAERIRVALAISVNLDGRLIRTSASIGVAVACDGDVDALLRDADLAMYEAKDAGRDCIVLFEREMRISLLERIDLESELRNAIDSGQLRVFYQPLCELPSARTTGFEALVRWEHPNRGLLEPDIFLPIADALGLTPRIDNWVLVHATAQLQQWTDEIPEATDWTIAVNASAVNFSDQTYAATVNEALVQTGLEHSRLTIEVTEHAVLESPAIAREVIGELQALGIKVAIDDFGTGYSSFSQLASLAFDVLKIDRSLVRRLDDETGREVFKIVIQMAQALGLKTVAEGIESEAEFDFVRDAGADVVQGFLLGVPTPPELVVGTYLDSVIV